MKQSAQGLLCFQSAAQPSTAFAGYAAGVIRHADTGLPRKLIKGAGQWAGGDIPSARLAFAAGWLGTCAIRQGTGRQARAEEGRLDGVPER